MQEGIRKLERFWENLTKRDSLIIVKFISSSIYQFRFVKFLLVLFLLVNIPSQIIQFNLFINELNTQQFIQYSPSFCFMFYGILATIILLTDPRLVEDLFDEMVILPIEEATETTKLRIKKEIKIVSIFTICNTISGTCIVILLFCCTAYDYDTFLMVKYFTDHWPEYQNILIKFYKFLFALCGSTVFLAHSYQVIYYTQHSKYQMLMLIDQIDGIIERENSDSLYPKIVDDDEYQQQVKVKWISFVQRCQELSGPGIKKIREMSNYIVGFALCGVLDLTSIIYGTVSMKTLNFSYDYRYVPMTAVIVIITSASICIAGQSIETVSGDLHGALKRIKWYNMNVANRKIYLLMLIVTQRGIRIRFSENYSINYALGLAVARGTYSILSVLITYISQSTDY